MHFSWFSFTIHGYINTFKGKAHTQTRTHQHKQKKNYLKTKTINSHIVQ